MPHSDIKRFHLHLIMRRALLSGSRGSNTKPKLKSFLPLGHRQALMRERERERERVCVFECPPVRVLYSIMHLYQSLPSMTLFSPGLELNPEPAMVNLDPPYREPCSGETPDTSSTYSTVAFTPALHREHMTGLIDVQLYTHRDVNRTESRLTTH